MNSTDSISLSHAQPICKSVQKVYISYDEVASCSIGQMAWTSFYFLVLASVSTAEHVWWVHKHSLKAGNPQDVSQNTAIKTYSWGYNQKKLEHTINIS